MNWMMVLGSSGERLDNATSCLAEEGTPGVKEEEKTAVLVSQMIRFETIQTVQHNTVTFTF